MADETATETAAPAEETVEVPVTEATDVTEAPAEAPAVPAEEGDPRPDLEARATVAGVEFNHSTPNELLQSQVETAEAK